MQMLVMILMGAILGTAIYFNLQRAPDEASGRAEAELACLKAKGFPRYHENGLYAGCDQKSK